MDTGLGYFSVKGNDVSGPGSAAISAAGSTSPSLQEIISNIASPADRILKIIAYYGGKEECAEHLGQLKEFQTTPLNAIKQHLYLIEAGKQQSQNAKYTRGLAHLAGVDVSALTGKEESATNEPTPGMLKMAEIVNKHGGEGACALLLKELPDFRHTDFPLIRSGIEKALRRPCLSKSKIPRGLAELEGIDVNDLLDRKDPPACVSGPDISPDTLTFDRQDIWLDLCNRYQYAGLKTRTFVFRHGNIANAARELRRYRLLADMEETAIRNALRGILVGSVRSEKNKVVRTLRFATRRTGGPLREVRAILAKSSSPQP